MLFFLRWYSPDYEKRQLLDRLFAKALSKEDQEQIFAAKMTCFSVSLCPKLIVIFAKTEERGQSRQLLFQSGPKDD